MLRSYFGLLLICCLSITIAGCSSVQKKFFRKSKPKPIVQKFYSEKDFKRGTNVALYKEHINYFNSWMDNLLDYESFNYKSDMRNLNEAASQLDDLIKYVPENMKPKLQKHVKTLTSIADSLKDGSIILKERPATMGTIRSIHRDVNAHYAYNKVKDLIPKD